MSHLKKEGEISKRTGAHLYNLREVERSRKEKDIQNQTVIAKGVTRKRKRCGVRKKACEEKGASKKLQERG